jgi:hypothetical protein
MIIILVILYYEMKRKIIVEITSLSDLDILESVITGVLVVEIRVGFYMKRKSNSKNHIIK